MTEEESIIRDQLEDLEEIEAIISPRTARTLEIAGSAIFGALSIIIGAFLAPSIPRIAGWFIAIVDPISIIWIAAFLIFGVRAGILSSLIGTIGLMPFDPTVWVGPIMKFAATFATIIVPILFLKLYRRDPNSRSSLKLKNLKNYVFYGSLGIGLRIIVMIILNIVIMTTIYAFLLDSISLAFLGLPEVTGLTAIYIGAPLINLWQGALDLAIPYIIIYGGKLNDKFQIW